ncbi:MAG: hypothetical protein ACKPCM_08880, partial [Pseudanabaena sp.]
MIRRSRAIKNLVALGDRTTTRTAIACVIPNEEVATPLLHLKTLLGLFFKSQKCWHTFVIWY